MKGVESKIMEWRNNINYLIQVGEAPFPEETLKTIILGIVPGKVSEYAIQKYDECTTMDDLEKKMTEYIDRCEQLAQRNRKPLGAMRANDESQDHYRESQEQEEAETYEDEFGYKWICMAAPSAKRQRTEDNAEGNDEGESVEHKEYGQKSTKAGKGKGTSKGKGKKGPEGGCFDC